MLGFVLMMGYWVCLLALELATNWRYGLGAIVSAPSHYTGRIRPAGPACARRTGKKPAWVTRQLILLKAHMPHAGCRLVALTFNEHCFTSQVFSRGLRWLGIRHQRIDLHCPWQNGRVERFFGTLKPYLRQWEFEGQQMLNAALTQFAHWYNAIRPHQSLNGWTPVEVWHQLDPYHAAAPPKEINFVQGWDGLLCGFHIRR